MAQYTTFQAIQDHLMAQAPCSERSIIAYCLNQATDDVKTNFANDMTRLIEAGVIEYVEDDDGSYYMIGEM